MFLLKLWFGNVERRDYLEDISVDGRILKRWGGRVWTGFIWHRNGFKPGLL
jgi:hypothetical protein